MSVVETRKYRFGEFELDEARRRLSRNGEELTLNPKAFDMLVELIRWSGTVVSKDELLERVWPDQIVEENNLSVHVSALRKLLGEGNGAKFIATIPGRGYSFVAAVEHGGFDNEIVIENRTIERITIDSEYASDDNIRQLAGKTNRWRIPVAILCLILIAVAGVGVSRYFRSAPSTRINSIAVLPFVNQTADENNEYLSDGLAESAIYSLSRLPDMRVMSRNSAFRYKGKEADAKLIGSELNVQAILTGRINRSGDNLIVSAELISTDDNSVIWGKQFTSKMSDIEKLQNDIAASISDKLRIKFSGVKPHRTDNAEAYLLYLKGRFFWSKLTPEGLKKSLDMYQQAIEIDPNYALAYAGLADSYNLMGSYGIWPLKESHPKARAAAEKALDIDGQLAEAHTSLATVIADYYWDWSEAERHFKLAIELNPNYPVARYWYSQHLDRMGRVEEAVDEAKRAQKLDPLSSSASAHVGLALYRARRFDEAAAELRKALEFDPRSLDAHIFLGFVNLQQGESGKSIAEFQIVVTLSERNPSMLAILGYGYAMAGRRTEAQAILKELDLQSKKQLTAQFDTAMIYIGLREREQAFAWLEKAYDERAWQLGFLMVDPIFDPIRSDARFSSLVNRVGLP